RSATGSPEERISFPSGPKISLSSAVSPFLAAAASDSTALWGVEKVFWPISVGDGVAGGEDFLSFGAEDFAELSGVAFPCGRRERFDGALGCGESLLADLGRRRGRRRRGFPFLRGRRFR